MMSYRPYRPVLGLEIALAEIENNAGILYDRRVAKACLKVFRENGYQIYMISQNVDRIWVGDLKKVLMADADALNCHKLKNKIV